MPTTSADIRAALVQKLVKQAQVTPAEGLADTLPDLMDQALDEHSEEYDGDYMQLRRKEYEAVILLAWVRVCRSRASAAAPQSNLSLRNNASGFGADRDTPFTKNLKMAATLREQYNDLCSTLDIGAAATVGDIEVGDLYKYDELLGAETPVTVSPPPDEALLEYDGVTGAGAGGEVILNWVREKATDFYKFFIFESSTANIHQVWNYEHSSGVPQISPAASSIYQTTDQMIEGIKVTGLAAGVHYFIIVFMDTSGKYSYSNEITVTIPA